MPDYRLYRLNPHNGHIDAVETLSASDDVEAICRVQNRPRDVPVELWRGGTKVVRIDAPPGSLPEPEKASARPVAKRGPAGPQGTARAVAR